MPLHESVGLYFDSNFTKACFYKGLIDNKLPVVLVHVMAIAWTNADPVHWRIGLYAVLGGAGWELEGVTLDTPSPQRTYDAIMTQW